MLTQIADDAVYFVVGDFVFFVAGVQVGTKIISDQYHVWFAIYRGAEYVWVTLITE